MKTLKLRQYGNLESLELIDVTKPTPEKNQVLIRVRAVCINDWDYGLLLGRPAFINRVMMGLYKPKKTVGCDIAGVVEATGADVTAFQPGDEVFGDLSNDGFGGFADYVCVPSEAVRKKSPSMTFEQACTIPQAGMLSLQAIRAKTDLAPGNTILINGAGGGVGSISIQLLKGKGFHVTGVDSEQKLAALLNWGYDKAIDYQTVDFTQLDDRYDLIIDAHSTHLPAHYERALKPNGVYATVGGHLNRLLAIASANLRPWREKDKSLKVVSLNTNGELNFFNDQFENGIFTPIIDRVYDFSIQDIQEAFMQYANSKFKGKIVVKMETNECLT